MRFFSHKNRPVHLGPYPFERLLRRGEMPDLSAIPAFLPIDYQRPKAPENIVNAMGEYQAMLDAIRIGITNPEISDCPRDPVKRANHLKAFGYYCDASMVGICEIPSAAVLQTPIRNSGIDKLAHDLKTRQTKTLSSGIDVIMADLKESMNATIGNINHHTHAIVYAYEFPRDPYAVEPGTEWLKDAQAHRAGLRANETAVVIAQYLRLLGYQARSHSVTTSDVDLNRLCVCAGIASLEAEKLVNPYFGERFGLAAVTTNFNIAYDRPLVARNDQPRHKTHGFAWKTGYGFEKNSRNRELFKHRDFKDGAHPFERLKRVDLPTTYIDEDRVPRVPKRTDMFARSLFGDMGKANQEAAKNGQYVTKSAPSMAQRRALGALILLQDGEPSPPEHQPPSNPQTNAENVKAAAYFLGVDAVGISRCPDWTWYSHDAAGDPIIPPHDQAISIIIDQGFETMEGASGDDWIAVSQSMRAYLRFSLLGGVVAKQIRNLGYKAKSHTVMDGEVLQPPLLLLSGLGEVSRIGEVILNPYLGPRLKSGVITTDMPLAHDKPIDFGLQNFCENCNKCARECPSGAITAGPKLMFNGYEIWKSDSQKCTTYRITTKGGAMCGRCMKTCPWNLEGLFVQAPFRWAAMNLKFAAPFLAKLDDMVGNGERNPVKKWWWDIERNDKGSYGKPSEPVNQRNLNKQLDLKYEDQTLAVYPANLAPPPWPFPFPMDREKGIKAYEALISAQEYRENQSAIGIDQITHEYLINGEAPVLAVEVSKIEAMGARVNKYEFKAVQGKLLPPWKAGAHLDIVVAPEFLRQYSMSGDPSDLTRYQIAVLREDNGKGGSQLLHRIFSEGRKIFISKPINHFPIAPGASHYYLMGGGIGITPMIAMAHELFAAGSSFEIHYSCASRNDAGFLNDLAQFEWSDCVNIHFSDDGTRADLQNILCDYKVGNQIYCCGPEAYMNSVMLAAENSGFPENSRHLEYFEVPEQPEFINTEFVLRLTKSGTQLIVPVNKSAADILNENGIHVEVKCSDGLCGVCKCGLINGDVEHRDFVLSNHQRKDNLILCQSRALKSGGIIEIDL